MKITTFLIALSIGINIVAIKTYVQRHLAIGKCYDAFHKEKPDINAFYGFSKDVKLGYNHISTYVNLYMDKCRNGERP